jgi:hypothetical protein
LNWPVSGWRQGFIAKAVALTVAGAAQAQPSYDMSPCFPFNFPNAILRPVGAYLFASKAPILVRMLHHGVFGKLKAWQIVRLKARPASCHIHNLPPHFVLVFSAVSFMAL